jgi:TonB-dependent receptor
MRRYDYHRRRFGYGGEFAFQPNDDHSYYVRASVAGYTEQATKNRLTYDGFDQALGVGPAATFVTQADLSVKGTDEQETHRNQVYAVGGRDQFGDLILDYRAAYSRATFNVGYNINTTFNGPTVGVTFDNITNSDFPQIAITDGTDPNNAALYKFAKLTNGTEQDLDEEWSYAGNATFPVHLLNDADKVKAGFSVRLREKTAQRFTEAYNIPKDVLLSSYSGPANTDFYDGHYTNGPFIDHHLIRVLAAGGGGATSKGLVEDPSAFFDAKENIYAGYGQYTTEVGPWGVLAGVRVEKTEATYKNNAFDQNDDLIGRESRNADYTDLFPTVQLRYALRPEMIVRATYSTGIGRPGFSQIAQPTSIDVDNKVITTGNPNLKPTTGDNFDLTFEYYLPNGGILQLGAFDKQFDNYIVATRSQGTDPRLSGVVTFFTFGNISSAYARGIEAAYNQRFAWLPQPFDGLGVEANITAVDSQAALRSGESTALPGTSKITYNLAAFYENDRVQVRLAGEFVGKTLYVLGGDRASDVFQDQRFTMDFTSSYKVSEAWTAYFNVKNLTDEPLRFYEREADRPIQREFYDLTYEAGVRAKF